MKKILALVLVMAVSVMAVTFEGVDNGNGTVTISYNAPIVGLALDVDSAAVSVTGVTLPTFFDVFMDYAYNTIDQGGTYQYGSGDAIAAQDAAGVATLPSSAFCISAGGLEGDFDGDTLPTSGEITLAVTGTGTITISANTLRGGVVDYNGAMTTNLPIDIVVAGAPSVCLGDADGDGWVTTDDMATLVGYLNGYAPDYYVEVDGSTPAAYDYDGDGWITTDDIAGIVGYLNGYAPDYYVECGAN